MLFGIGNGARPQNRVIESPGGGGGVCEIKLKFRQKYNIHNK